MKSLNFDSFYLFILPPPPETIQRIICLLLLFYHSFLSCACSELRGVLERIEVKADVSCVDKTWQTLLHLKQLKNKTWNRKKILLRTWTTRVRYLCPSLSLMPPRLPQMPFIIIIITDFDLSCLLAPLKFHQEKFRGKKQFNRERLLCIFNLGLSRNIRDMVGHVWKRATRN